jgi:hypothetical protein
MSSTERLIAAIRAAGGSKPYVTSDLLDLAQSDKSLADALRAVFGKRLPTGQKLGLWLTEHLGATSGELKLVGKHSPNRKAWVYRVWTAAEAAAHAASVEARREEKAARDAAIVARAQEILANRQARRLARHMEQSPKPISPAMEIHVQPPAGYLETTSVDRDGRIKVTPILDRNGERVQESKPTAPVPQTNLSTGMLPPWTVQGRRPTRAELAARHAQQSLGGVGGFSDPAGVVSARIFAENSRGVSYCRVVGTWPGGRQ